MSGDESERLPPGWAWATVEAIGSRDEQPVLTGPFGSKLQTEDFQASGTPVLTIGCLTSNGLTLRKANYIDPVKAESFDRYALRPGDLVFSRMASVGKACLVSEEHAGAIFNYHLMRLRLADDIYDKPLFIHYIHGAPSVREYLKEVSHGATRDGINTSQLLAMPVQVPPLNEQKRIVAKIEALQARSDAAKQALDAIPPLLEQLRQSVLAAAFRGDLTKAWREAHPDVEPASELLERIRAERRRKWEEANPKKKYVEPEGVDAEGLPELPESWCWASLEEVSSATRSICYGVVQPGEDDPGGVPLVRVCDIMDGMVDATGLRTIPKEVAAQYDRSQLEGGEVLVTVVGTIGRVGIAPHSLKGANIARAVARIVPAEAIGGQWLLLAVQSPRLQDLLARESREVARKTLNIGTLAKLAIPLAPQNEAIAVVQRVNQILAFERQIRSRSIAMENPVVQLTQSILAKAFRGELVPQDPNDEPASVLLDRIRAERSATAAAPNPKRSAKPKQSPRKPPR